MDCRVKRGNDGRRFYQKRTWRYTAAAVVRAGARASQ